MTVREQRIPGAALIATGVAMAAFAVILYLSRRFSFYYDEWDWVLAAPTWTAASYFQPHNEHWSTIPMLIYKLLFSVFGARHYLPFMVPVLLAHAGVLLLLFRIVRRRSGDLPALLAVIALAFIGRGFENLLWGFQVGFVGSVFFGLLAWDLVDRSPVGTPRAVLASLSLVAALMCSGVGLFFVAAVAADLVFDPRRRRQLTVLVLPLAAYIAWYLATGHTGVTSHRSPLSLEALQSLGQYLPFGVGAAAAGLLGFPLDDAWLALAVLVALLGFVALERRQLWTPGVIGAAVGLLAQFGLAGLVRAQLGVEQAAAPRYVYIGSVFLLLILTSLLGAARRRRSLVAVAGALTAMALLLGAYNLRAAAHDKNIVFNQQRAELQTVELFRDSPGLPLDSRPDPILMPTVNTGRYLAAIDALGSPVPAIGPGDLAGLPAYAVDGVLRQLFGAELAAAPAGHGAGCRPSTGSAPDGSWLKLGPGGQSVSVYLWSFGLRPPTPTAQPALINAQLIQLPVTRPGIDWRYAADPPVVAVCSSPG